MRRFISNKRCLIKVTRLSPALINLFLGAPRLFSAAKRRETSSTLLVGRVKPLNQLLGGVE